MSKKKPMSPKTKKTLLGIGITFGTIAVFFVSFFLAFSLIINPITIMPVSNGDAEKENKELKAQITKLEDENEHLETTVEKYRASSSAPKQTDTTTSSSKSETKSETKTETKTPSQSSSNTSASNSTKSETKTEPKHENEASASQTAPSTGNTQSGTGFSPETVTTPEGGASEEPEESITVIDISE